MEEKLKANLSQIEKLRIELLQTKGEIGKILSITTEMKGRNQTLEN
jgi:hypothetical protein